ncbi:MAG: ComEA family DNA-binding protein, partial [Paludibacteraceae bacterium]
MQFLTRQQGIGILALVILIAALELVVHWLPYRPSEVDEGMLRAADDSLKQTHPYYRYQRDTVAIHLCLFDPNTADSATLVGLGLAPWQARNMLRYRAKGGVYRRADDLRKLYGMTDSMYAALKPYIQIDSSRFAVAADSLPAFAIKSVKRDTVVELNSADTASLQAIRGIGAATARAIIRYREELGGYVDTAQLREIDDYYNYVYWDIPWDSILPYVRVCTDSVRLLRVNSLSVRRLAAHPYLRFEDAKAVYTLRRNRFRLDSIGDLKAIPTLPDSVIEKI